MRTSKNGKKKCLGMLFCGYNHMLCKMSSSWGMCTQKNKKNEMSGYGRNKIVANATYNENKNEKRTPILRKPQISGYAIGNGHIRKLLRSPTLQPLTPYILSTPRNNLQHYAVHPIKAITSNTKHLTSLPPHYAKYPRRTNHGVLWQTGHRRSFPAGVNKTQ